MQMISIYISYPIQLSDRKYDGGLLSFHILSYIDIIGMITYWVEEEAVEDRKEAAEGVEAVHRIPLHSLRLVSA